jgi:C4-dicarboxylate-specific signal transduction histidine kinase
LVAMVGPAALAGRMLVAALAKDIDMRMALVSRLIAEGHAREATLKALESTRAQLTHAQKVEIIGQMAGGIAHDMNNALTALMGEASMLDDSVAEERERILASTMYAAQLTQQLMIFGRRDICQPRAIDLVAHVRASMRSLRRLIPVPSSWMRICPPIPSSSTLIPSRFCRWC